MNGLQCNPFLSIGTAWPFCSAGSFVRASERATDSGNASGSLLRRVSSLVQVCFFSRSEALRVESRGNGRRDRRRQRDGRGGSLRRACLPKSSLSLSSLEPRVPLFSFCLSSVYVSPQDESKQARSDSEKQHKVSLTTSSLASAHRLCRCNTTKSQLLPKTKGTTTGRRDDGQRAPASSICRPSANSDHDRGLVRTLWVATSHRLLFVF